MLTCFKLVAFAVADYPELRGAAIDRAIICAGVWMNRTLPRAHPEEFNMSGCFAPGDGMSHTICLLCLCAANGTLRCAPHGEQETESGKDAERARNSRSSTSARARRELTHMLLSLSKRFPLATHRRTVAIAGISSGW